MKNHKHQDGKFYIFLIVNTINYMKSVTKIYSHLPSKQAVTGSTPVGIT